MNNEFRSPAQKKWISLEWTKDQAQYITTLHYTSIKNNWIKLKDEVGMMVSKSTRTRFVVGITYTIHPYAWFFHVQGACFLHSLACRYTILKWHCTYYPYSCSIVTLLYTQWCILYSIVFILILHYYSDWHEWSWPGDSCRLTACNHKAMFTTSDSSYCEASVLTTHD